MYQGWWDNMSYMDKSIEQIHNDLKENKVTSKELIKEAIEKTKELQKNVMLLLLF